MGVVLIKWVCPVNFSRDSTIMLAPFKFSAYAPDNYGFSLSSFSVAKVHESAVVM